MRWSWATAWMVGCSILLGGLPAAARQWTDRSGTYRIEAELVSVREGKAYLERSDGKVITVPLDRLSAADLRHLASLPECRAYFEGLPAAEREQLLWPKDAGQPAGSAAPPATGSGASSSTGSGSTAAASPAKPSPPEGRPEMPRICPNAPPDRVGQVGRIRGFDTSVDAMTFSPNGRFLVVGAFGRGLAVVDLIDLQQVTSFEPDLLFGQVECLAFTPDGRTLLVASQLGRIGIFDFTPSGGLRPSGEFGGHTSSVHAMTVSRDGTRVLSGGDDRRVRCWTLADRQEQFSVGGFTSPVKATFFTRGGKQGLVSDGAVLVLLDMKERKAIQTMALGRGSGRSVAIAPDGSRVAVDGGFAVQMWAIKTGQGYPVLRGGLGLDQIVFLPNSRYLLTRDSRGVGLWELASSQRIHEFGGTGGLSGLGGLGSADLIAVSPDNRHFATASMHDGLRIFRMPPEVNPPG